MVAVKIACTIAVVAIAAGTVSARVPKGQWVALYRTARGTAPEDGAGSRVAGLQTVEASVERFGSVSPGGATVVLPLGADGQFHADLDVEGRRVPALVDTGASFVSLSYEAAGRLGYFPAPADFTLRMRTANGITTAAPIEIAELRVGAIVARHVKAIVSERGALTNDALLGMSFLHQLGGFSIEDGRLVLKQ